MLGLSAGLFLEGATRFAVVKIGAGDQIVDAADRTIAHQAPAYVGFVAFSPILEHFFKVRWHLNRNPVWRIFLRRL